MVAASIEVVVEVEVVLKIGGAVVFKLCPLLVETLN
jgi:hypothetical protein